MHSCVSVLQLDVNGQVITTCQELRDVAKLYQDWCVGEGGVMQYREYWLG